VSCSVDPLLSHFEDSGALMAASQSPIRSDAMSASMKAPSSALAMMIQSFCIAPWGVLSSAAISEGEKMHVLRTFNLQNGAAIVH